VSVPLLRRGLPALALGGALVMAGCAGAGSGESGASDRAGRAGRGGGPLRSGGEGSGPSTAVPVEVARVERRTISAYLETNGTLEAENEVDLVARVAAPVVQLLAEEGLAVRRGQTLVRLDEAELRAQMEMARVALNEATLAYERAKKLIDQSLISSEQFEQAQAAWESAAAQHQADKIRLGYATVTAPFDGLIVARYVDLAQQVSVNTPLFRLSDFDPLLCPIQVPERELPKLSVGQPARIELEGWSDHEFAASVLRIGPVVDAATGTVKVTLEIRSEGKLRPGMFARVYLETATRPAALVIPKAALSLDSVGDTVYVAADGVASRREVTLGFRQGDFVEITEGVSADESVVVVGHDGLSDGTPIQLLSAGPPAPRVEGAASAARARPDLSKMTPEELERAKTLMRARGMTEEQIEARIRRDPSRAEFGSR